MTAGRWTLARDMNNSYKTKAGVDEGKARLGVDFNVVGLNKLQQQQTQQSPCIVYSQVPCQRGLIHIFFFF